MKLDWSTVAEIGIGVLIGMAAFKLLDALFIDKAVESIKGNFEAITGKE